MNSIHLKEGEYTKYELLSLINRFESNKRDNEIRELHKYDISFVNPTWKEDAYDLILQYKGDDQSVIKSKVRFMRKLYVDIHSLVNENDYELMYKYVLIYDSKEYDLDIVYDTYGNKYIHPRIGSSASVHFLEIDECIRTRKNATDSSDSISIEEYDDIDMYIVFKN